MFVGAFCTCWYRFWLLNCRFCVINGHINPKENIMNLAVLEEKSYSTRLEILTSKRKCTLCKKKLVDGKQVAVVYSNKGKIRGYFCSDDCIEKWA